MGLFNGCEGVTVIEVDPELEVVCDFCNEDYTDSDAQGGFLFSSYSTCPKCTERIENTAKEENEEHAIIERANPGETFRDFVMRMREAGH